MKNKISCSILAIAAGLASNAATAACATDWGNYCHGPVAMIGIQEGYGQRLIFSLSDSNPLTHKSVN